MRVPRAACTNHLLVQHRDGKEPWCKSCGGNRFGETPKVTFSNVDDQPDPDHFWHTPEATDYMGVAKELVSKVYNEEMYETLKGKKIGGRPPNRPIETTTNMTPDKLYVVWFCKTLQNWKALLSSTLDDGIYYEVTHNGDENETYVDVYRKFRNITVDHNEEHA